MRHAQFWHRETATISVVALYLRVVNSAVPLFRLLVLSSRVVSRRGDFCVDEGARCGGKTKRRRMPGLQRLGGFPT